MYFFHKFFFGNVLFGFDNPAKMFLQVSAKFRKNLEKTSINFIIQQFFHKKFMKTLDRSFDKRVGTLEPKVRKTFACYPLRRFFNFFKCIFFTNCFLETCCSVLTFLSKNSFRYKPRKLPLSVRKKVVFFFIGNFLMKFFPLACKVQFWQLSRNFYVEFLESFTELPHVKKQGFAKSFLHAMIHWTQRVQFWQTCRKCFAINPKYFGPQIEIQFKKPFFSKKGFPWRQSSGKIQFSFEIPANNNLRKHRKI